MATLVILTAITLFGSVGAGGWEVVVYPDPANTRVTSDSPLPLAVGQIVSRDSPFFALLTGIGLIGLVASFHGILIAASRAVLELGRVGYAPAALGRIHDKTKTPAAALIANMTVGLVALVTGRTQEIILIAVFGALTLYVLSSAAVIRLRIAEPDLERPYRAPLYPITPVIALGLSLVCIGAMVWSYPWIALVYAAIVAVSWGLFVVFVPADRRVTFR
jgi:ethanolamine permease